MILAPDTLPSCWQSQIGDQFTLPYMQALNDFLSAEIQAGKNIYPAQGDIFNAFIRTPFDQVKVVILGQDPYHGAGQAHGLSFSVGKDVRTPPSLKNIYKEIYSDLGQPIPDHGNLTSWADQGVLLLNSVLTVEATKAASHKKKGWEQFTDHVINQLNTQGNNIVFMLWGAYAQKKASFVDTNKHLVLSGKHPSPLSAHGGWFGCKHFSQANNYLSQQDLDPIDWAIEGTPSDQMSLL